MSAVDHEDELADETVDDPSQDVRDDDVPDDDVETDEIEPGAGRGLTRALTVVMAVAVLVIAVAAGWFWGDRSGSDTAASTPSSSSVDAGFARDMSVHHRQAVTMAEYELAHGSDEQTKLFAFDINATQSVQLGEMQGWLDSWNLNPVSAHPMSWMGSMAMSHVSSNGLMPGMASAAQMNEMESFTGKKADVLFLQLMIRHHQGGVAMAEYAAAHATQSYVQLLAQKMVNLQNSEIIQMQQQLQKLGGTPLPPPVV